MSCVYPNLLILFCWLFICHCSTHFSNGINNGSIRRSNNKIKCIGKEREALLNFKHGIAEDTCQALTSWGHEQGSQDCCSWPGVRCSNRTGRVIMLDLHGHVRNHGYYECYLNGKLSPSLGELKHLKHLDLSNNQIAGEIPHQLGNLSRLTFLDLSNNFHLSSHSLHWLSHLTLLTHLNLRDTDLTKATNWFKVVNNLPSLKVLHFDNCGLPSTLLQSNSYINSSSKLEVITLAGNNFNETSIDWLFNSSLINTHLMHIDLSFNSFSSSSIFSVIIDEIHTLSYLDLSYNQLEGKIPDAIGNMNSLSYLDLSHNRLKRLIPDTISNLKSLEHLYLSDNSFSGPIPDAIGNLANLTVLSLAGNSFSGPIPDAIKNLKSLNFVDLSNNSISNTIPDSLGSMSNLTDLDLSHNLLTGVIPSQLFQHGFINSLDSLDLSFNNLSGPIPSTLWNVEAGAFLGNSHLCGAPLPKVCPFVKGSKENKSENDDDNMYIGLFVSAGIGFYLGFWGVCGTLVFKHSWRYAFFQWIDNVYNKMYVIIALYVARFQKNPESDNS